MHCESKCNNNKHLVAFLNSVWSFVVPFMFNIYVSVTRLKSYTFRNYVVDLDIAYVSVCVCVVATTCDKYTHMMTLIVNSHKMYENDNAKENKMHAQKQNTINNNKTCERKVRTIQQQQKTMIVWVNGCVRERSAAVTHITLRINYIRSCKN